MLCQGRPLGCENLDVGRIPDALLGYRGRHVESGRRYGAEVIPKVDEL